MKQLKEFNKKIAAMSIEVIHCRWCDDMMDSLITSGILIPNASIMCQMEDILFFLSIKKLLAEDSSFYRFHNYFFIIFFVK